MRIATALISLTLSFAVFVPSCGEGVWRSLSLFGFIGTILWIGGAGLVYAKPRVSMWIYGVASLAFLAAGATGYTDGFVWAVASVIFAAMSWRGIKEKARMQEQETPRYQSDRTPAGTPIQQREGQPPQSLKDLLPGPPPRE